MKYIENIPKSVNGCMPKEYINNVIMTKHDIVLGLFLNSKLVAIAGLK